ncbi:GNAT family N-acetyltransferase [Salipaludibacillus agaradhaerens]|jgi:GNAT superfamily N-acetyltransferase|uniref:GNAT family N-acetyltransferase n=1 Tax=Salipaludibacillus agaradhaerens TaxID=76935 RepID=UPI0014742DC9|nr:GNAT family N-acetyltransferase [Salipaludibacillus agaradhaerens]MCR6105455.1 GNAT family N-acetyltransferase [Salipaludibacillus agaradhaerens]MCR6117493.1 GNAT family N-acetyltransferase [Salipaludibacillus agaradhaerens]UJW56682.1 GNAT family N-acetyltransferase [Bacillus sp. A116_S68]
MEKIKDINYFITEDWHLQKQSLLYADHTVRDFKGEWYFSKGHIEFLISYIEGVNDFSGLTEGYIEIYTKYDNDTFKCDFSRRLENFITMKLATVDVVYIEMAIPNGSKQSDVNKILKNNSNLSLYTTLVEKSIKKMPMHKTAMRDIECRAIMNEDVEDVLTCLKKAYSVGLLSELRNEINVHNFNENIQDFYKQNLLSSAMISGVVTYKNKFAGHVTFSKNEEESEATLVDLFIIDEYKGLGLGKELMEWGGRECLNNGIKTLKGTVDTNLSNQDPLVSNLMRDNWKISKFVFLVNGKEGNLRCGS